MYVIREQFGINNMIHHAVAKLTSENAILITEKNLLSTI